MPRKSRSQTGLVAWMTETSCPVFMVDQRRRVRFFNQGCVERTGCQPGDMIGKTCDYISDPLATLSQRILHAIAPPSEVFQGQQLLTDLHFIDAHGQPQHLQVIYLPLPSEDEIPVVAGLMIDLPEPPRQLQPSPTQALHARLAQALTQQAARYQWGSLIAHSPAMQRVATQLKLAQSSRLPVHLTGPAGSGKQYLAHVLHESSNKQAPPLVILDLQLLPRSEIKRLLKDALSYSHGRKETSGLLLNQIDQLPADLQEWLLEQLRSPQWPGGLRLLTTSRLSLSSLVSEGIFSDSLFYALTPICITVPGLRERTEDIELLAQYFLEQHNPQRETQLTGLDRQTLDLFLAYDWNEHAAELKRMIDESVAHCPGPVLLPDHLPFRWQTGQIAQTTLPAQEESFTPLEQTLEQLERSEILRALAAARQNKARAAELLGLTRPRLYRRLETLGLLDGETHDSEDERT